MASYHQIIDEIEITPEPETRGQGVNPRGYIMGQAVLLQSWPKAVGVMLLIVGLTTVLLGSMQVFPNPLLIAPEFGVPVGLYPQNCYGAAMWSGAVQVMTGSLALRAVTTKRVSSVRKFFSMTVFALLVNVGFMLFQLYADSKHWTPFLYTESDLHKHEVVSINLETVTLNREIYKRLYGFALVHLLGKCFCLFGLILLSGTVARYYDAVLFGEVQLLRSLAVCLCPCWFFKEEDEDGKHTCQ